MAPVAAYDEIADWYENDFLVRTAAGADPLGIERALRELLGRGSGICLEVGCGTGVRAGPVRDLGWIPAGIDVSAAMLRPGGVFVHIGVHPCFCGGFADRSDTEAVVIRRGYLDGHWTKASWTDQGVRDKVGATHLPLPGLLHAFLDAGLTLERFTEGGEPTPVVLAVKARKRQ
jgi:hypothetical protein